MIVTIVVLLCLLHCSQIYGTKFRFDYTFVESAEGWLKLHRVPATWGDARLLCHAEGSVLVSPLTQQLHNAVIEHVLFQTSSAPTIFTGVHTMFSKGSYASIEGVPLSRLPITWMPGEPNNLDNAESCLVTQTSSTTTNATVGDVRCNDVFPFVCYKKKTDTLVFTECGTHDKEYKLDQRTGSCYKFHRSPLIWSRAQMTCMAEGGHLIIINSEQESVLVRELYAKNPDNVIFSKLPQFAYVGIFDSGDGGSWMTVHGQTLEEAGFERWKLGQPENGTQPLGEFCVVINREDGELYDNPCNWLHPFICEKSPESLN